MLWHSTLEVVLYFSFEVFFLLDDTSVCTEFHSALTNLSSECNCFVLRYVLVMKFSPLKLQQSAGMLKNFLWCHPFFFF